MTRNGSVLLLVTSVALTGCGGPQPGTLMSVPTGPSATSPNVPTPTVPGSIAITPLMPSPGATLTVRQCPSSPWVYGGPGNCSYARVTAELELTQSVSDAVVSASYYRGSERCGIAYASGPTALAASTSTTFTTNLIEMSDEYVSLHCDPLPAESNRLVLQVWSARQPATPLLTQEFAFSYTFVN